MNNKIVIPISIIITIVIVVFGLTQNQIIQDDLLPEVNESPEIQNMLNKINTDKIENDQ